jgi:aspartate racemase
MKTIGLLGGMSWESSLEYYRIINEAVKARLGGLHSAKSIMYSFDFAEIEALQRQGDWQTATERMIEAAQSIERGGADFLLICANTMHKMADEVQACISIPLLHIADPTAEAIRAQGLRRVGLLGTRFTMEEPFYRGRLLSGHGLEVIVPGEAERETVHRVIYDELCQGIIRPESRDAYNSVIQSLAEQGAEAVILGCTEIGLLVRQEDSPVPLFDTTRLHAEAAVAYALQELQSIYH